MKKSKIKFYNLDVYTETLDNGLNVVVIPYKNVNDAFVTLTTRYGGANYEFRGNQSKKKGNFGAF